MAESAFTPAWFSKPGETISALMESKGLTAQTLSFRLGHDQSFVQGLLDGHVVIDTTLGVKLSESLGGSPEFWRKRQAQFEASLDRAASSIPADDARSWIKTFPVKEMVESGWISQSQQSQALLRSILAYFDVCGLEEWRQRYTHFHNEFAFRTSPRFESKIGALSAWLRQGERKAASAECDDWNADKFRNALLQIRVLTKSRKPDYFIPRLRALCASAGVAIVFVRAPTGCRASGATRFMSTSKAMIIMSFRYLSDDHFWFTFFHEAGHLLLHGPKSVFVDGEDSESTDMELQANAFSAGMLVPSDRREELLQLRAKSLDVIRFAVSVGVSPGIIVGQMQHYGAIGRNQLNKLKRRYDWNEITAAIA